MSRYQERPASHDWKIEGGKGQGIWPLSEELLLQFLEN